MFTGRASVRCFSGRVNERCLLVELMRGVYG